MFPGFKEFNVAISPLVTIHGIKSGIGPPILLIHGFPQTHHIWHIIAPQLTSSYTVVLIDLRGYGQSSKPPSTASDSHVAYAKSTMATDCVGVMGSFGFQKFDVISHDRGARVAAKLAVDYPEKIGKLMLLDIAPTLAMFEKTDQAFATAYWHWFFLIQPSPFPEQAILSNPEIFKSRFFGGTMAGPGIFTEGVMEHYMKQFNNEQTLHSMCEDYRAAATIDLVEARNDLVEGRKIKCPVRVLWGSKGVIEKQFEALELWRTVCEGEVSGEAVDAGHYIAEEAPDVLMKHVKEFFVKSSML